MNDTPTPSTRAEPNPRSLYADADRHLRHLFPVPLFMPAPLPGHLAPTGCNRLAVVPPAPIPVPVPIPDGVCPTCIETMRNDELPEDTRPVQQCITCQQPTRHGATCALCRIEAHAQWWEHAQEEAAETGLPMDSCGYCGGAHTGDVHATDGELAQEARDYEANQSPEPPEDYDDEPDGDPFGNTAATIYEDEGPF